MIKEFKAFILKGNVLDLAVAVVIGGAFGKIVASLVNDIIMPFIGMILGGVNFTNLKYIITPASEGVEESAVRYGAFIQSIIDFAIIAFAIFVVIKMIAKFQRKKEIALPAAPPEPPRQEILLEEIRDLLKK